VQTHVPPVQTVLAGQVVPHAPQFCSLVWVFTQPVAQHVDSGLF
jgi:hypothetical protein